MTLRLRSPPLSNPTSQQAKHVGHCLVVLYLSPAIPLLSDHTLFWSCFFSLSPLLSIPSLTSQTNNLSLILVRISRSFHPSSAIVSTSLLPILHNREKKESEQFAQKMGNIGRIFCVALPFALTVASIIALLVACLAGVTDKSLYLFKVNTTDLSISSSTITSLLSDRGLPDLNLELNTRDWTDDVSNAASAFGDSASDAASDASSTVGDLASSASDALASATASASDAASDVVSSVTGSGTNITAADLGLADAYIISLWNYCEVTDGERTCKKARYNWAANATDSFEEMINSVASSMGENITLPDTIKSAMDTFSTISRWTQIVFIIAFIALAAEIALGFFANCSRAFSCCTAIIGMFATVAVIAAATLATATAAVVVAAVEGTAKAYGVTGSLNSKFLSAVWVAAAFAIAAGFFWLFTICCCSPDRRRSGGGASGWSRSKHADETGVIAPMSGAGGYQHLSGGNNYAQQHNNNTAYGGAAADYYGGNNDQQKFESYRPVQQRY